MRNVTNESVKEDGDGHGRETSQQSMEGRAPQAPEQQVQRPGDGVSVLCPWGGERGARVMAEHRR